MFCKNCGKPLTGNEAFCKNCGAIVEEKPANASSDLKRTTTIRRTINKPALIACIVIVVIGIILCIMTINS